MPNFIDDRHLGLLAYIGNKARAGKLKDANITPDDINVIINAIQDRDRVIKELSATIEAQDEQIADLKFVLDGVDLPLSAMED
jgi:hypothetical protein